jgi:S-adenosyl-L-methionine hydrolase (adenosine-forming)
MAAPLVTLTTDFGLRSPYVAAMKGAILSVNAAANLVDLCHNVPPQDLRFCNLFLRAALPFFPLGTLHVVVVDPGVGTERALLYVEVAGQRLIVPDNGCWTALLSLAEAPPLVVRLTNSAFWRSAISATFHGRDIFAPVAGHLSLGLHPEQLGPRVFTWVDLSWPRPRRSPHALDGEVIFADDFGNLLTNISTQDLQSGRVHRVTVNGTAVDRVVQTYGEAPAGTLIALISSADTLEVAEVHGNAARRLGAMVGTPIRVELGEPCG